MSSKTVTTEKKFTPTTGYVKVGEMFVCNCGIPLAKHTEKGYELIKYSRGQSVKIKVEFGSMIQMKCEKCGRGFACLRIKDSSISKDSVPIVS